MITHTKVGLWDWYVDNDYTTPHILRIWPATSLYIQSIPYLWRMIIDIVSIPECRFLLAAYCLTELAAAFMPAITLSYSGQMLSIVI